jgi:hypothetical protein
MRRNLVEAAHALNLGKWHMRSSLVKRAHALKSGESGACAEIWWRRRMH